MKPWYEPRTWEDAPKERLHDGEVWAEGWNACVAAATAALDAAYKAELGDAAAFREVRQELGRELEES